MALSTTQIDNNRGSNSISLPVDLSQAVIAKAVEQSAIMQLAQQIALPGRGEAVPVITADATAAWNTESTEKAVSNATYNLKTMKPYKLAVIEMFSDEFRRDIPALYDELERRLPGAIAKKFDYTVVNGTTPGTGFDTLASSPTQSIVASGGKNVYQQLCAAMETLASGGFGLDGFAIAAQGRVALMSAVDGDGRPLFVPSVDGGMFNNILGAKVVNAPAIYKAGAASTTGVDAVPNVVGVAGDWSQARWGIVDGINIAFSDQATINDGTNQVNLFQRNMFALRVEAELGFICTDDDAFVKLTTPYSA